MRHKALIVFTGKQICLFGGVAVCIALRPAGLSANGGISYYGIFADTFPFYAISLLGTAICSLLAAWLINPPHLRPLRYGLLAFGLLLFVVTFTDAPLSALLGWSHTIATIILFFAQISVSFWILAKLNYAARPLLAVLVEVVSGAFSLIYILPQHGFLIQSEIIFQLAFMTTIYYSFKELLPA